MSLKSFLKKPISARAERLRALSLLKTLSLGELRIVDALLHEREFVKEEVIFDEGEEGQALYIVLEGVVLITRRVDGIAHRIAEYRPGEFFGEIALVDHVPRSAQARAAANCRLAVLFREDFLSLLNTNPVAASKMTLEMARHLAFLLRQRAPSSEKPA